MSVVNGGVVAWLMVCVWEGMGVVGGGAVCMDVIDDDGVWGERAW